MTVSPLADPGIVPDPYPTYAELADRSPVLWCDGLGAWAVLRHADCVEALKDNRLRAERMAQVLSLKFPGDELAPDNIYHRFTKNVMMYTDPPLHDDLRRSTSGAFTRAAHAHYSDIIKAVAEELVESIPLNGDSADAVHDLAAKLPVQAAVRAFGVPAEDLDKVVPHVNALMTYWSGPREQPIDLHTLLERLTRLHEYSLNLLEGREGVVVPGTVIARLAEGVPDNPYATKEQALHQLVLLLIALFAPTTPGSLSSGIMAFANNPDQIEQLRANPEIAGNAAEEVVRYNASNQFTWRVADEPIDLGGQRIRPGDAVALFLGAANRDPAVFENPNNFDIARPNSSRHLSFGVGVHSCLGRQIALLELKWFFSALFARYPKVTVEGEPDWNPNLEFRSLRSLPIGLR